MVCFLIMCLCCIYRIFGEKCCRTIYYAPYHPGSNPLAERVVKTRKENMKAGGAATKSVNKKSIFVVLDVLLLYCELCT